MTSSLPASLENQRRTRDFSRTSDPVWKQTMVFAGIQREDLPKKYLEISVWSYNIYEAHELLGQVIIHLSGPSSSPCAVHLNSVHHTENFIMDDDPVWYPLGGEENVFRLNSELPHKRPPRCRILRSAYRSQRHGSPWPDAEVSSPATSSVTGFPACSPTTHVPGQTSNVKKVSPFPLVRPMSRDTTAVAVQVQLFGEDPTCDGWQSAHWYFPVQNTDTTDAQ